MNGHQKGKTPRSFPFPPWAPAPPPHSTPAHPTPAPRAPGPGGHRGPAGAAPPLRGAAAGGGGARQGLDRGRQRELSPDPTRRPAPLLLPRSTPTTAQGAVDRIFQESPWLWRFRVFCFVLFFFREGRRGGKGHPELEHKRHAGAIRRGSFGGEVPRKMAELRQASFSVRTGNQQDIPPCCFWLGGFRTKYGFPTPKRLGFNIFIYFFAATHGVGLRPIPAFVFHVFFALTHPWLQGPPFVASHQSWRHVSKLSALSPCKIHLAARLRCVHAEEFEGQVLAPGLEFVRSLLLLLTMRSLSAAAKS